MRWRISAWTHPEDPAGFKLREHSIDAIRFRSNDPSDARGRCTLTVPEDYDWRTLLATQNPANASDTSLLRLYRDGIDNTGTPDQEFLLKRYQKRITDDGDSVVDLYGQAWKVAGLDAAVLRWWDWTPGATSSKQRDWSFGGDDQQNLLPNADFRANGATEKQSYHLHANTGQYTLTVPTYGTTSNLNTYEGGGRASDVETALEAIAGINDVVVTGKGHTQYDPLVVEFVDPSGNIGQMTVNDVSLNQASCAHPVCHDPVIATLRDGGFEPEPWTYLQDPLTGTQSQDLHGSYDDDLPTVVDDPDIGAPDQALRIDPATSGAGAQVIIDGEAGFFANANVQVYSSSATDEFTLQIVDQQENLIAKTAITTLTANTWTTLTIATMTLPDPLPGDQLVFRVQVASSDGAAAPAIFHIRNPFLSYGYAAATIGDIAEQMLAHAPSLARIPYVNQGAFTDLLDEDGVAWARSEHIILRRGGHYATHFFAGQFRDLGYEYDLTPDATNPENPDWDLKIWNEGARGATLTGIAFHVGLGVAGGLIAGRLPRASRWLGEGKDGIITEKINAAQETATGINEAFFGDPDITDVATLGAKAQHFLDEDIANRVALSVDLDDSAPTPYADFGIGDTAEFAYAGTMDKNNRRISEVLLEAAADTGGELHWTPTVTASRLFVGEGATREAIYQLLLERDRFPEQRRRPTVNTSGKGGGAPTLVVAAADATDASKNKADYICDGLSDDDIIQEALDAAGDGRVLLTEGIFKVDAGAITITGQTHLQGVSRQGTIIRTTDTTGDIITLSGDGEISDLTIEKFPSGSNTLVGIVCGNEAKINNIAGENLDTLIDLAGADRVTVSRCFADTCTTFLSSATSHEDLRIIDCHKIGIIDLGANAFYSQIIGNTIDTHITSAGGTGCLIANNLIQAGDTGTPTECISLTSHVDTIIMGNQLEFEQGIDATTCNRLVIVGNMIGMESLTDADGIVLDACDDCLIEANLINMIGVTTDNTYDGIRLEGDSDRNHIISNRVIGNATAFQPRYAINISAAACDDNSYLANRSGPASDYAAANPYNDAGTGTINTWPAAAAPRGDNLL